MLIGMIYVTSRINWRLALVALLIAPFILLVSRAYRAHLRKLAHRVTTLESSAASMVQEVWERSALSRHSAESITSRCGLLVVHGKGLMHGSNMKLQKGCSASSLA